MNKNRLYKLLYKKAADAIGEEELTSLKNDLINPVKIATKEALDDILNTMDKKEDQDKHIFDTSP
jgi:hypothetical protein